MALQKYQILNQLKYIHRLDIWNINELNTVMTEMGLLQKETRGWIPTQAGMKYSCYDKPYHNADLWKDKIVDVIAEYMKGH